MICFGYLREGCKGQMYETVLRDRCTSSSVKSSEDCRVTKAATEAAYLEWASAKVMGERMSLSSTKSGISPLAT